MRDFQSDRFLGFWIVDWQNCPVGYFFSLTPKGATVSVGVACRKAAFSHLNELQRLGQVTNDEFVQIGYKIANSSLPESVNHEQFALTFTQHQNPAVKLAILAQARQILLGHTPRPAPPRFRHRYRF